MDWLRENRLWFRAPLALCTVAYILASIWVFGTDCPTVFQRLGTAGGALALLWTLVKVRSNTAVEQRLQLVQQTLDAHIQLSAYELANVVALVETGKPLGEKVSQSLSAQRGNLVARAEQLTSRSGERNRVHDELNHATQVIEKIEKQDFSREITLAFFATLQGGIGYLAVNFVY